MKEGKEEVKGKIGEGRREGRREERGREKRRQKGGEGGDDGGREKRKGKREDETGGRRKEGKETGKNLTYIPWWVVGKNFTCPIASSARQRSKFYSIDMLYILQCMA